MKRITVILALLFFLTGNAQSQDVKKTVFSIDGHAVEQVLVTVTNPRADDANEVDVADGQTAKGTGTLRKENKTENIVSSATITELENLPVKKLLSDKQQEEQEKQKSNELVEIIGDYLLCGLSLAGFIFLAVVKFSP